MNREVVIVSAVRTAIGSFGGTLKDFSPSELGAKVVGEAMRRADLAAEEVGHVVFGNVIHTEPKDMYLARVAAINGGVSESTPAFTLNRLCGSGLQAIVSAAQSIMLGDVDTAIAGGAESMSRAPHLAPAARWGTRMGDSKLIDMLLGALQDPFHSIHMGVTAEYIAERYGISREEQDALAVESHRRAANAIAAGRFVDQILPISLESCKSAKVFDTDEHVRPDIDTTELACMRAVFQKPGTVTAGNASGINDGSAALVLMERGVAERRGLKPLAKLLTYAHAGVDPEYMGIGPVPATRTALGRAGLTIDDIDVIESNEAFASQACAVMKELRLDPAKVNPNGSGISLGHPIGATGAIIAVKAAYELQRTGGRYALVTMCVGGGQGISAILERV